MSLHTWHHHSPRKPSSCATSRSTLTGAELPQAKKVLRLCPLQSCAAFCRSLICGLPGNSVREEGVLQATTLERTAQYWLPYPSRALYFLLPSQPTPLSTWCCQNPCGPSSWTTSALDPHKGKPKSSRAASEANPSEQWMTHMQRWK